MPIEIKNIKKYSLEILILGLLIVLFYGQFPDWVSEWLDPDSFYAFSIFMFLFIGYKIKQDFDVLKNTPRTICFWGILPLLTGLFLYLVGYRAAFEYILNLSLPFLLLGIILTLYGWQFLSKVAIHIILFASTISIFPLHRITLPFQVYSAKIATVILNTLGINSFSEGVVFYVNSHKILVTPGCSGLKSIFSIFFLCVIYSFFLRTSSHFKKGLFILLSFPIAISMNILRLTLVGLYSLYNQDAGILEFHDNVGIVVYVLSVLIIFLIAYLMEEKPEEKHLEEQTSE